MIAAPVQCDVDGIPKGSHYATPAEMPAEGVITAFNNTARREPSRHFDRQRFSGRSTQLLHLPKPNALFLCCLSGIRNAEQSDVCSKAPRRSRTELNSATPRA